MTSLRRILLGLFVLAGLLATMPLSAAKLPKGARLPPPFSPDRVLVAFRPGSAAGDVNRAHSQAGGKWLKTIDAIGVQVVEVPAGTVKEKIALYQRNPNVQFAEPNYQRLFILPDEGSDPPPPAGLGVPYFAQQYGLNNTGQTLVDPDSFVYDFFTGELLSWGTYTGAVDADIDATEAWDVSQGDAAVKIAIIDSGVDCVHPDIQGKCVEQLNFTGTKTLDPNKDLLGHGTHVAGIGAANTNNGIGVAGVGYNSSIGALKACYEYDLVPGLGYYVGLCDDADTADALTWAADHGYHVVNMSFGGPDDGATMHSAVQYAWGKDVVLVAAAGNDYSMAKFYPAAYPEAIAVGATDRYDNLTFFSNFYPSAKPALPCSDASDPCWVDVLAPGLAILSTVSSDACGVTDCYDWKSGTSMAAPHVAGVAALVRAKWPADTNSQVKARIENSADQAGALGQNMLSWSAHGRVNAHGALTGSAPPPPASITLTAVGYKVKGLQKADLGWGGTSAATVDIWRGTAVIGTTANDGSYTDNINVKGTATYTYKVCEAGSTVCSNEATVVF